MKSVDPLSLGTTRSIEVYCCVLLFRFVFLFNWMENWRINGFGLVIGDK